MPLDTADLEELYRHLHSHPELSFQEHETAALVATHLTTAGYEVTTGIGGTGVVGVLRNGPGPTALLRADMDALPVAERTGLPYASTVRGTDPDGHDVPVMHACGHDLHVVALLGAARELAADTAGWAGTLVVLFQPAEELGAGARAMIDDGLYDRFPRPDVVLGQHVSPLPAGLIALHPGPAFAAADAIRVTLHGTGGHGSRPETGVDPIVMAAAIVLRLQTIPSREVAATEPVVVTVGALRAGTKANIIPDQAELLLSIRTFDEAVRTRVLTALDRIVNGEATASGAPTPPEIVTLESFPVVTNDEAASARTAEALTGRFGAVVDPGAVTGSEDVGLLASAIGIPCVYWLLGGSDHAHFAGAGSIDELRRVVLDLPSNHSPLFAPVLQPTLDHGIAALVTAAHAWLPA